MIRNLLILYFFSIGVIECFSQNPNPSSTLDVAIQNVMNQKHLPGVSTLIVKDGEIVWMKSYGYANTDLGSPFTDTTSLMLASVSKVFTGTALMQLYESGLFSLNDPVSNYLPFALTIPNFSGTPVTFRMLLTHTSSIADSDAMDNYYNWNGDPTLSLADCMQRYFSPSGQDYSAADNFLNAQSGTVYEYSNMGAALEGYLVELISGISFNDYCKQHIFNKLCMSNTHWYLSEYQNLNLVANPHDYYNSMWEPIDHYGFADYPDGMLHSNVRDLANFMIAMLQNGFFNNNFLLSESVINTMFTAQVPTIEPTQGLQFYKENFSSGTGTVSLWGHSGGEYGISTEMYFDPTNDMGIVLLANGENEAPHIVELLYDYGLTLSAAGTGNPPCNGLSGIEQNEMQNRISVFPNPTSDYITVKPNGIAKYGISIFTITGQKVIEEIKMVDGAVINVSGLAAGIYIYHIREENKLIAYDKLVISER